MVTGLWITLLLVVAIPTTVAAWRTVVLLRALAKGR